MTTAELEPASTKATTLGASATMQPGSRFQSLQTSSSIITNF
jgi:hypothetical protein